MIAQPDGRQRREGALTADVSAAWNPKIREIHAYWRRIHPAPDILLGRQHFDPLAIAGLLPNIWLVDVVRPPARFRYRLMGTRIVDAFGHDWTGRWLDEVHPDFGPGLPTFRNYLGVAEDKQVSWRRGRPVFFAYSDACSELERIYLPLAGDGATVDMILALTVLFGADGQES